MAPSKKRPRRDAAARLRAENTRLRAEVADLRKGRTEAEAVYRRDLEKYPKNGWSLFGLSRSRAAQRKAGEARWAGQGYARLAARGRDAQRLALLTRPACGSTPFAVRA